MEIITNLHPNDTLVLTEKETTNVYGEIPAHNSFVYFDGTHVQVKHGPFNMIELISRRGVNFSYLYGHK